MLEELHLLLRCSSYRVISGQSRLQVDDVRLLFCQPPVPLCQHGVHLLSSLLLNLQLLPLESFRNN